MWPPVSCTWRGSVLVLALAGCDADDDGSADEAPPECDAVTITLTDAWDFEDLAVAPEGDERGVTGVALGDVDGDGWLDAVFAGGAGAVVFRNDGTGRLVQGDPLTDGDGVALADTHSVALADLDADGDLDGILGREDATDGILRGDGAGHFTFEPLPDAEVPGLTTTGQFGDADGDGDLDVYLATGIVDVSADDVMSGGSNAPPDRLFLNDGTGHFVEGALPVREAYGHTFEGRWFDAEGDGDLDVYEANDGGPWIDPNHLLLNDGAGHFTLAPDCGCELAMYSMGAAVGDGDDDGLPDLYISDVGGPNYLWNLGDDGFVDATLTNGSAIPPEEDAMTGWGTTFVDIDGDRCQDLVMMLGQSGKNTDAVAALEEGWVDGDLQPDVILKGDCAGGFTRTDGWGFGDPDRGRSVAVGDLDRDGRPDFVTTGKYYLKTWHLSGGCGEDVVLTLDAGPENSQGVGARIVTEIDGRTTYEWMLPGTVSSSSAAEAFVGLGGHAAADRITIEWLEGGTTVLEHVGPGRVAVAR